MDLQMLILTTITLTVQDGYLVEGMDKFVMNVGLFLYNTQLRQWLTFTLTNN